MPTRSLTFTLKDSNDEPLSDIRATAVLVDINFERTWDAVSGQVDVIVGDTVETVSNETGMVAMDLIPSVTLIKQSRYLIAWYPPGGKQSRLIVMPDADTDLRSLLEDAIDPEEIAQDGMIRADQVTLATAGFNSNLDGTVDNVQLFANRYDDASLGGAGGGLPAAYTGGIPVYASRSQSDGYDGTDDIITATINNRLAVPVMPSLVYSILPSIIPYGLQEVSMNINGLLFPLATLIGNPVIRNELTPSALLGMLASHSSFILLEELPKRPKDFPVYIAWETNVDPAHQLTALPAISVLIDNDEVVGTFPEIRDNGFLFILVPVEVLPIQGVYFATSSLNTLNSWTIQDYQLTVNGREFLVYRPVNVWISAISSERTYTLEF